jgi:alkylation response protein AidB-like acyl-CoA dehydrogenase
MLIALLFDRWASACGRSTEDSAPVPPRHRIADVSYMPGDDAEELRAVVRQFFEKNSGEAEVRRLMESETGFDRGVWERMATEVGLQGLALTESVGGGDASLVELGVVFDEMGQVLFCGPFLSTVGFASTALSQFDTDPVARELLSGIASGQITAALAWGGDQIADSSLRAAASDGWLIDGTAEVVIDGATADTVLVAAQSESGPTLFAVEGDAPGLTRSARSTMDQTRKLASVEFRGVPARLVGTPGAAGEALTRTQDIAALLLAAEQLGGASKALALSVDYARTRYQFGRAIGSFQAIKHRCADMLIDVETARSAVYHGLWTAVQDPGNLAVAASLARAVASDVYLRIARHTVQIHGGIGFTWEHPAHLYLKRAKSSQLLLGLPATHRARLAETLGLLDSATSTPQAALADTPDTAPSPVDGLVEDFLRQHPVATTDDRALRAARFDAGLAVIGFDEGAGGLGLDSSLQARVEELFARAGCPDWTERNVIGLGMAMPTLHKHGTAEQRARYLRPCFTGEEIWCQLFSEPGAGSDLAALATRAVRDGDEFVVNGQKVWTSLGHVADFAILVTRTDPDVPKHKGLTYFVLDMHSPGVEVRPLRQLTGDAEFNEVYFTDVRIPVENVVGEVGGGWAVAMTTLANERESLGSKIVERGGGTIAHAVRLYRAAAEAGRVDAATTERLMLLWTEAEGARLTNVRAAAEVGHQPGPEGSIAKLQMADLNKAIYDLCVDLSGLDGLLVDGYAQSRPAFSAAYGGADVKKAYLRSLANSIEGGTSEVLRNILGERVLGLPGEPRLDRDIPWRDIRRG